MFITTIANNNKYNTDIGNQTTKNKNKSIMLNKRYIYKISVLYSNNM